MKSKELFQLAVKILGLVFLYQGFTSIPKSIGLIWDALRTFYPIPFLLTLVLIAWPFLVANWLLRGAPLLVRIAFPSESSQSDPAIAVDAAPVPSPEA